MKVRGQSSVTIEGWPASCSASQGCWPEPAERCVAVQAAVRSKAIVVGEEARQRRDSFCGRIVGAPIGPAVLEHRDVVWGRVGAGITRTQAGHNRLTAGRLAAERGMEAEAALVGAGGAFLLRVRGEEHGVDVEHDAPGRPARPSARARAAERAARIPASCSASRRSTQR